MTNTDEFIQWLDRILLRAGPGFMLPTDQEMANRWGLALSTVFRTIRRYRDTGRLVRVPGTGTFVPAITAVSGGHASRGPRFVSSAEKVATTIADCIRRGDYRTGDVLPQIKYIQRQFNITTATACKAYGHLQQQGLVTKIGKVFHVGPVADILHTGQLLEVFFFYQESDDLRQLFTWQNHIGAAFLHMESELRRHGCQLIYRKLNELPTMVDQWLRGSKSPRGLILYHLNEEYLPEILDPLRKLTTTRQWDRRPGVLVHWHFGDYGKLPKGISVLPVGLVASSGARTVARFLVQQRTGWACLYHNEAINYLDWGIWILLRLKAEVRRLDPHFDLRIFIRPHDPRETFEQYLKRQYAMARSGALKRLQEDGMDSTTIRNDITLVTEFAHIFLSHKDTPTWVISADENVEEALNLCHQHRIRVPGDLSILGLENNPAYYHLNVSSCRQESDRLGYLMAHAILQDFPLEKNSRGAIKTDAAIVRRLTT